MRVLLTLLVNNCREMNIDTITAIDFMTIYASDFGIADYNLHGNNIFNFSEYAARRALVQDSLKELVLMNLIDVRQTNDGFLYGLNARGKDVCDRFSSDYAADYISLAYEVSEFVAGKSDTELVNLINETGRFSKRG